MLRSSLGETEMDTVRNETKTFVMSIKQAEYTDGIENKLKVMIRNGST